MWARELKQLLGFTSVSVSVVFLFFTQKYLLNCQHCTNEWQWLKLTCYHEVKYLLQYHTWLYLNLNFFNLRLFFLKYFFPCWAFWVIVFYKEPSFILFFVTLSFHSLIYFVMVSLSSLAESLTFSVSMFSSLCSVRPRRGSHSGVSHTCW